MNITQAIRIPGQNQTQTRQAAFTKSARRSFPRSSSSCPGTPCRSWPPRNSPNSTQLLLGLGGWVVWVGGLDWFGIGLEPLPFVEVHQLRGFGPQSKGFKIQISNPTSAPDPVAHIRSWSQSPGDQEAKGGPLPFLQLPEFSQRAARCSPYIS